MAYNITLEGKNTVIAERMLQKVASILDDCQITYWLEGGTLLGIRRENRLPEVLQVCPEAEGMY